MRLPAILCGLLGLFLTACAGTTDRRVATDSADTVTGTGLQSMDIKAMATQMAADIKASGTLAPKRDAERASFYIYELDNQSSDRIDKVIILEAIRTEIAKSMGRTVKILDRSAVAGQLAGAEREGKDSGELSGKNHAKLAGADYALKGTIRSRDRQAGNLKSSYIVVTFELTDLVEQELVWTNNYDIKSESEKSVINR
jgi:TolB-like protein